VAAETLGAGAVAQVTVLLPVRNGAAFIDTAITSVLSQTFQRLRLVVSDNGSTDDTAGRVSRHADPRLVLVRQPRPLGMIEHFNKCLDELVETPYYMLLCHDDYLCAPAALQEAFDVLESRPGVSAVYTDLLYVDKAERTIMVRRFSRAGLLDALEVATSSVLGARNLFGIPLLVRTQARGALRYDTRFTYAADLDLSIALASRGETYRIGRPLIANRFHGANASLKLFRETLRQLQGIADKHSIALTRGQRSRMRLSAWSTAVKKWLFFQYLAWGRK
jgi:glycosyltransferase involved in cell wall biosynthesis